VGIDDLDQLLEPQPAQSRRALKGHPYSQARSAVHGHVGDIRPLEDDPPRIHSIAGYSCYDIKQGGLARSIGPE